MRWELCVRAIQEVDQIGRCWRWTEIARKSVVRRNYRNNISNNIVTVFFFFFFYELLIFIILNRIFEHFVRCVRKLYYHKSKRIKKLASSSLSFHSDSKTCWALLFIIFLVRRVQSFRYVCPGFIALNSVINMIQYNLFHVQGRIELFKK